MMEPCRGLNLFVCQWVRGVGEKWPKKTKRFTCVYVGFTPAAIWVAHRFTFGLRLACGSLRWGRVVVAAPRRTVNAWRDICGGLGKWLEWKYNAVRRRFLRRCFECRSGRSRGFPFFVSWWVDFWRGVTLGVTERGYILGERGVTFGVTISRI